jgi:hypothetical protein
MAVPGKLLGISLLMLTLAISFFACSDREQSSDALHAMLPKRGDMPGTWVVESLDNRASRPGDLTDSSACRKADELYGPDRDRSGRFAGESFESEQSLYIYFFAEAIEPDWWSIGLSQAANYFSSPALGECLADWLAENTGAVAGEVVASPQNPAVQMEDGGTAVAWSFHKDGEAEVLRWETYLWRQGDVLLIIQAYGRERDIDAELISGASRAFRTRADRVMAKPR